MVDSTHRRRGFGENLYKLACVALYTSHLTKKQVAQLQKYFGYWVKYNNSSLEQLQGTRMVTLEHAKGNHKLCEKWCAWVKAQKENKLLNKLCMFTIDMEEDILAVIQVEEVLKPFVPDEKLDELAHQFNT